MKKNKLVTRIFQYFILSIIVVIVFVPIVILVFGALKTRGELLSHPYALPIPPRWENITLILGQPSYLFWQMMRNSLGDALCYIWRGCICSLPPCFARMDFAERIDVQPVPLG
jgi:raffinose/stachyose/melibiose transport system permease protein